MDFIKGLPIYSALVNSAEDGVYKISLVDNPAMESLFLAYDKEEEVKYSVQNEEQRVVYGVLIRSDFPIFRTDKNIGNHYQIYSKDVIRDIAEKMFIDGTQNNVNQMHKTNSDVNGVNMFQCFIKDSAQGINPVGFESIEDGSLFAAFKVENDEVWENIKNGTFKGFSIEAYLHFELLEDEDDKEIDEIMNLIKDILK